MILITKKEVDELIKEVRFIEENFWLKYKLYNDRNRELLEEAFDKTYEKLYEMIEGKQVEMEIEENAKHLRSV